MDKKQEYVFDGPNVYVKREFPANEMEVLVHALTSLTDAEMFLAGGALLPHSVSDYDVFVIGEKKGVAELSEFWRNCAKLMNFDDVITFEHELDPDTDADEDAPSFSDSTAKIIVTLIKGDKKIDVIYLNDETSSAYEDFADYMADYFPLSVQEIALNLRTGQRVGNPDFEKIIVKRFTPAFEKYSEYYPSAKFYDVDGIEI